MMKISNFPIIRRGCTRLLLYFNTDKPHSFFFCRIPVVLENRRSSPGGGGRAHPLHPPPRSAPVISWWNHQSGDGYLVDELSSLCGYNPEDKRTLIFNYFFLLGERDIFTERFEQKTPTIDLFFDFVKGKLNCT